ncbi:FAD-dependent monooxygenase [Sorangium sp. So ce185]|uniref:FAD-dependent monooxygenase n=1 Tax=Sorangium sp. So ce185 TaxID=3133287 RepID=UPI003F63AB04
MTDPEMCAALIVGAGPTGLTLACELARSGVSFRLIEAAPGPRPGSRGKGIQPRTLEVFDDLGIVDRVIAHGRMAMPILSTAPHGRVTLGGAIPETLKGRSDIPYPASLITPQWRTEDSGPSSTSTTAALPWCATTATRRPCSAPATAPPMRRS